MIGLQKGDIVLYETNIEPVRCGYGTVDCEFECYLTKITQEKQTELVTLMCSNITKYNTLKN